MRSLAWPMVCVLLAGCIQAGGPNPGVAGLPEQSEHSESNVLLRAGNASAIIQILAPEGENHDLTFRLPEAHPSDHMSVELYRVEDGLMTWQLGMFGSAGDRKPFGFWVEPGEWIAVVVASLNDPALLDVSVQGQETGSFTNVRTFASGPAWASGYYAVRDSPTSVHVASYGVSSRETGIGGESPVWAHSFDLWTDHATTEEVLTISSIVIAPDDGGGHYEINWEVFGTTHHATGASAAPLLGKVAINTEVGEGNSALRLRFDEAVVPYLFITHNTVPFDSEALGLHVEPRVEMSAPTLHGVNLHRVCLGASPGDERLGCDVGTT